MLDLRLQWILQVSLQLSGAVKHTTVKHFRPAQFCLLERYLALRTPSMHKLRGCGEYSHNSFELLIPARVNFTELPQPKSTGKRFPPGQRLIPVLSPR